MPTSLSDLTVAIADIDRADQLRFLQTVIASRLAELTDKPAPPTVLGLTILPGIDKGGQPYAQIQVETGPIGGPPAGQVGDDPEDYTADYNGIELVFNTDFQVIDARGADAVDG